MELTLSLDDYCRTLEAHLCRKNEGHLVRIVGPGFERVRGWCEEGIPLRIAEEGIDRYVDRYYAKGPRRRPVQIEFCDADVRDVFDEWRRAVGVPAATAGDPRPHASLPAHMERVVARLTTLRTSGSSILETVIVDVIRELDGARARARSLRGDARQAVIERLRALDGSLLAAARSDLAPERRAQFERDAHDELRPFKARMAPDAYAEAHERCVDRLIREHCRLPIVALE